MPSRILFDWFAFELLKSLFNGSNLNSNASNVVRIVRIWFRMVRIPFEWFEFAFKWLELLSNSSNMPSNASNFVQIVRIFLPNVQICI